MPPWVPPFARMCISADAVIREGCPPHVHAPSLFSDCFRLFGGLDRGNGESWSDETMARTRQSDLETLLCRWCFVDGSPRFLCRLSPSFCISINGEQQEFKRTGQSGKPWSRHRATPSLWPCRPTSCGLDLCPLRLAERGSGGYETTSSRVRVRWRGEFCQHLVRF